MTVKELKEAIANLPDDMQVIVQKDSEGNGYSPLAGADPEAIYIPDSTYSGTAYNTNWSAEDAAMPEVAWSAMLEKSPRALILYPTN